MQQFFWIVWFLVGHVIHMNLKVTELMQFSKKTYREILTANYAIFLYRSFAGVVLFVLFVEGHLVDLIEPLHVSVPAWATVIIHWPMNWAFAGLIGLALDSLLGYIPGLKSVIPPEPGGN